MTISTRDTVVFIVQLLSLIFLIIYVIKTWEMASATRKSAEATEKSVIELRETRDQESSPYIIVYFDVQIESRVIYLVVKNIGRTIATQVHLQFTPSLQRSDDFPCLMELSFIKNGIASMPPNYEIRTLIDSTPAYFGNNELPLKFHVIITYYGGVIAKQRVVEQTLDLSANKGLMFIRPKNITNLCDEVTNLVSESRGMKNKLEDIASSLVNGLLISNPSFAVTKLEPNMANWKESIIAILSDFEYAWSITYVKNREQGIGFDRLQTRSMLISEHLLDLLANNNKMIPKTLLENCTMISSKLSELGNLRFYADGGESLRKFNEFGDSIITDFHKIKLAVRKAHP
jgi:hypothetical protein